MASVHKMATHTQGTVVPSKSFSAEKVAQQLHKAMDGLGTDEKPIIAVMASHDNKQRQEIALSYKTQFGKDLRAELKCETSGNFENLLVALLETPINYDAKSINCAIKFVGTDEGALIEILSSRSKKQIKSIKAAYKALFNSDIEKDISSDTSGHLRRFLVSQLAAGRSEDVTVDAGLAAKEADELFAAGEQQLGTDESVFNRILTVRSYPQLLATFDAYKLKHGKEIETAIKCETSGYLEDGYLSVVKLARSVPAYFAERLYNSMNRPGTRDSTLIRVIVTRSEIDMVQIKSEFQRLYGKSLASFIKGDTSGDYEKLLLALIKEE